MIVHVMIAAADRGSHRAGEIVESRVWRGGSPRRTDTTGITRDVFITDWPGTLTEFQLRFQQDHQHSTETVRIEFDTGWFEDRPKVISRGDHKDDLALLDAATKQSLDSDGFVATTARTWLDSFAREKHTDDPTVTRKTPKTLPEAPGRG